MKFWLLLRRGQPRKISRLLLTVLTQAPVFLATLNSFDTSASASPSSISMKSSFLSVSQPLSIGGKSSPNLSYHQLSGKQLTPTSMVDKKFGLGSAPKHDDKLDSSRLAKRWSLVHVFSNLPHGSICLGVYQSNAECQPFSTDSLSPKFSTFWDCKSLKKLSTTKPLHTFVIILFSPSASVSLYMSLFLC